MDDRVRQLEREWQESGDVSVFVALYAARKRAGLIPTSPQGEIPDDLVGYSWNEVFACSGEAPEEDFYTHLDKGAPRVAGSLPTDPDAKPFGRADIKHIIGYDQGENEGPNWVVLMELWDGRFGYCEAGCDYTGFD